MRKPLYVSLLFLLLCLSILSMAGVQTAADVPFADVPFDVNSIPEPVPPPPAVVDFFDLDPFYQQWINVGGFPVLASANVSPYAVKENAWEIGQIIGHRSDILKALGRNRARYTIIAHNEVRSDLPEFRDAPLRFYYDVRQRGGGGVPMIFGSEEWTFRGTFWDAATHEMAHGIHTIVNREIDTTFDQRLETVYNAAMAKGLWQGSWLSINHSEYWAEGITTWFHANPQSPIQTRNAFKAYDPDFAQLITEVFGDTDWRYTPMRDRLDLPHLQGLDLQAAPREVEWPPGVEEAYEELRDPAINERSEWVNLPPYDPSLLPRLNELRNRSQPNRYSVGWTDILVGSVVDAEILLYWVNPDGTETLHYRFPPGLWSVAHFRCRVGDLLLAKDTTGRPLAVFQAVEKTGRVLLTPTFNLITLGLSKSSGDNQAGVSGAVLANPLVIELRDENLSVLEGISVTFTVTVGDGILSMTRTTTDENGRAESVLTLGPNQGINTVSVSATGIEGTVTFNATAEAVIDIPDANLRAAIETTLGKASGDPIAPSDMETLTRLTAGNANISNLIGLEAATHLTELNLWDNNISDISAVVGLTNLTGLGLGGNSVTDISPVAGLANLTLLHLPSNPVGDISFVAGLTNLTYLNLNRTDISDISPIAGLTHLTDLYLGENNITDISHLTGLTDLRLLWLQHTNISDLAPLVTNTGLGSGDEVKVDGNPLSYTSINTHIPTLRERGVVVSANNLKPPTLEYLLSVSAGLNLIHVPLQVSVVDGMAVTIESISDLYDALGGVDKVNFLITYDTSTQDWLTYFGVSDRGTTNDKTLTYAMGIIARMKAPTSVRLTGKPLGNNGTSTIGLDRGLNVVGLPLRDSRINRVNDLLKLDGIQGNVPVVIVTVDGDFKPVGRAGDPGDIPITGGQGFLLHVQRAARVTLSGEGWTNVSVTAVPQILTRLPVRHTTPVLALRGSIIDEATGANRSGFRVVVKNLLTGRQVATTAADAGAGYRLTVVDIETARAATVGDVLDISAQSFNPFIGVEPLRYTVTAEDVLQGWIQLPELIAYEIPKETELLANYPNPFNPETWIPYHLAADTDVQLTIYDTTGAVVRRFDLGLQPAGHYTDRAKAVYWDGRNDNGEPVVSGVYFYQLNANDYSATRRMVILK